MAEKPWNYSGDPSKSPLDAVRYLVRDTDPDDPLLLDKEIEFALTENGNSVYRTAADCCLAIASELGRRLDITGPTGEKAKEKHDQYINLEARYREKASLASVSVYAGGVSISDKHTQQTDSDRAQPEFSRDLHRIAGTGQDSISRLDPTSIWP